MRGQGRFLLEHVLVCMAWIARTVCAGQGTGDVLVFALIMISMSGLYTVLRDRAFVLSPLNHFCESAGLLQDVPVVEPFGAAAAGFLSPV